MINSSIYLATRDIAERTGVIESCYRTKYGLYIINHNDLMRVRFSTEELLQGIGDKVQQITKEEATSFIQENNYQMGVPADSPVLEDSSAESSADSGSAAESSPAPDGSPSESSENENTNPNKEEE